MYMRKIMVGKMFAGGRVSSFPLTLLARHSVRRPRPLQEGTEVIFEPGAGIAKGPILPSRQSLIGATGDNSNAACAARFGASAGTADSSRRSTTETLYEILLK